MITIVYITCRRYPMIEWFFDSLHRQCGGDYSDLRLVIVDFYAQAHLDWTPQDVRSRMLGFRSLCQCPNYRHVPPKPTPWAGPYRLTKNDYFCAANSRNTGICYCPDPYIAFVDDLSVLGEHWIEEVRRAAAQREIHAGAFRKVLKLEVENGRVKSFEDHPGGWDSRWVHGLDEKPVPCHANWLFGCSFCAPVDDLLLINGAPEICDSTGVGMEDCHVGIALGNNGRRILYNRRMFTYESEERHHIEKPMLRMDKKDSKAVPVIPGVEHPKDKGHYVVAALAKTTRFENYFGQQGLAGLRQKILNGEPFSTTVEPVTDFYDNQPLSEL